MKINVNSITKIDAKNEPRIPPTLVINVDITEGQAEHLFYEIWTQYGDEVINNWLNQEGKEMIDKPYEPNP